MKKIISLIVFLIQISLYAQPENQYNKGILVLPKEDAPTESPKNPTSWWKSYVPEKQNPFLKSSEKNIDFTGKSKYVQRKFDLPQNLTGFEQPNIDVSNLKGDKYFGDFVNNGNFMNVYCRDHEAIDGDLVNILLNDEIVAENVYLSSSFRGFNIPLKPGFNKIEFVALNEGESRPNTAEFRVLDEKGNVIVAEKWMLLTGYKARFIIVKNE